MCEHTTRVALKRRAYSMPNRSVQRRTASCERMNPFRDEVWDEPLRGLVSQGGVLARPYGMELQPLLT
jgi:hypothetical protein